MGEPIIRIESLNKQFRLGGGLFSRKQPVVRAVDDFSFEINEGEIVGLVGESGSGKTTLARVLLSLTPATSGSIMVGDTDISKANSREIRRIRSQFAVVFQDPASNLNPRQTVRSSIMRPMLINGVSRKEAQERAVEALEKVKMDTTYLDSYPHQLSGGQQQRIAIARALVLKPRIMILDEPTSALDISVQAQVLNLLLDLQEELGLTYLVVTHDLNVIRYISDRVAVMYMGQLVEYGPTDEVMKDPEHPYTRMLMASVPVLDPGERGLREQAVVGEVGSLLSVSDGCRMKPRCELADELCGKECPRLREISPGHYAACFKCAGAN